MSFILKIRWYLLLLITLTLQFASASPTDNEFTPCRKLATKTLEHCLKDNNPHNVDICWADSKTAYTSCREEIFFSHAQKIHDLKKAADQKTNEPKE